MAERSERVENFHFPATHEYTEAGIEQATVAMQCHGANSPEPRRRAVPGSDTSALRAADQQLYNSTSLTTWAHRRSLSKRRELVLSSLVVALRHRILRRTLLPWPIDFASPEWNSVRWCCRVALSAKSQI